MKLGLKLVDSRLRVWEGLATGCVSCRPWGMGRKTQIIQYGYHPRVAFGFR
jgi:hypothetical protein